MGLSIPTVPESNAAAVWAYATRLLTSLQNPADLQKYLGGPAGALGTVLPANKSLYDLIVLDRLDHGTFGLAALNADLDLLLARLTAARALYLDYLNDATFGLAALNTDLDALLSRLTALRAGYLDNINNANLLNVPNVKIMEHEIEFPSAEALDDIALTGAQTTTERTITVTLPTGATIRRALLIGVVTAMNNTVNAQKIDVTVQGRKGAGAWNNYFSQTDCIGFGAVDGSTVALVTLQDVTALVDAAAGYGFRLTINQSSASSVRYTSQFLLVVTYRMS